jgi:hypothetical protein
LARSFSATVSNMASVSAMELPSGETSRLVQMRVEPLASEESEPWV